MILHTYMGEFEQPRIFPANDMKIPLPVKKIGHLIHILVMQSTDYTLNLVKKIKYVYEETFIVRELETA